MRAHPDHRGETWTHPRGVVLLGVGMAVALLIGAGTPGCARHAGSRAGEPTVAVGAPVGGPRFGPAYESLRRAAERGSPKADDRGGADTPPPRGLDAPLANPIPRDTPEGGRAREPLESVLAGLRAGEAPRVERVGVNPQEHEAAVRRYVVGREKLLRGDPRGAIEDLKTATRLDPGAPEPWRELGEAQLAAGSPGEAAVSMQAAVERGLEEARALEFLGRLAEDRAEFERATQWLARADALEADEEDPALPLVVRVSLGRCLLKTGRLAAGREALAEALELPGRPPSPTRYAQEVAAIYGRQGELWREIGDADCRLGQYERALEAYARAASLPAIDNVDLAPRVFFAATRSGRPAAAAVFVLERIGANEGFVTRDDQDLLSILASDRPVARDLARALGEYRGSLPAPASPSVVSSLERARAAVLGGDEGRSLLRQHLSRHPGDALAAGELLRLSPDPIGDATRLGAAHPEHADRYADAVARVVPDADAAADTLGRSGETGARLTGLYLLTRVGRVEEAWRQAESLRAGGPAGLEVEVARMRLAASQGRWSDAERALAAIGSSAAPDTAWARVRALWALKRPEDALRELAPLLETPDPDPARRFDRLMLGAELAARSGQVAESERLVRAAAGVDPRDDRPYAQMLSLYGPAGPLANPEKLTGALRDLRANVPDSRLASFLRAQEFLRRSFFQPAERELRRLAEPDPTDGTVLEMLSGVWTRLARNPEDPDLAAALAWLDEQSKRRPWADTLVAARARVLASAGRADDAESLLQSRLRERPTPEVSRLLEILLRERGRGSEADLLAEGRLAEPPLSIDEAIELAELRARQERDADAAEAVRTHIPAFAALEPEQARRLLALAAPIADRAQAGREGSRDAALSLLDDLARRHVKLTPELHERRLTLLAGTPEATDDRLLAAAEDAVREYPQIGAAPYLRLSRALEDRGRAASALALIERAAAADRPPPDLLAEWLRLIVTGGAGDEARRAIDRAASTGQASTLVDRIIPESERDEADKRNPRAVLAYQLAIRAAVLGRDGAAEDLYELCLEYDPAHPWANNNLGYTLVERGEGVEAGGRAERLLEAAHEALPADASILDSLGWLRYRQGVLEDVVDMESGRTLRHGAVPLLERAARTERGQVNQTILDHYGDALWLIGRREEARRMWEQASRMADARLRELRRTRQDDPRDESALENARREVNQVRASTRRKIEAADRGLEPPVAPRTGSAGGAGSPGE